MGVRTDRGSAFIFSAVLQGVLLSLVGVLAVSLLLGIIMTVAGWDGVPRAVLAIHYLAAALGGFIAARRSKTTGWLHGAVVGLLGTVIIAAVFASGETGFAVTDTNTLMHIGWGVVAGAVGGIVGVSGGN